MYLRYQCGQVISNWQAFCSLTID